MPDDDPPTPPSARPLCPHCVARRGYDTPGAELADEFQLEWDEVMDDLVCGTCGFRW